MSQPNRPTFEYAYATAVGQGSRPYQEDCVQVWQPQPSGAGGHSALLVVVCDGMGGHVAGEIASKVACQSFVDAFSKASLDMPPGRRLEQSLTASNDAIRRAIKAEPGLDGMGCTIVACYVDQDGLRWASVGDSSLLVVGSAGGGAPALSRLNEDHSLGAFLDRQAKANVISLEDAQLNPLRRTLRSALLGKEIPLKEVIGDARAIRPGDWLLVATDGLETLSGPDIAQVVARAQDAGPQDIADALLKEVDGRAVSNQDNVSIVAIKVGGQGLAGSARVGPAEGQRLQEDTTARRPALASAPAAPRRAVRGRVLVLALLCITMAMFAVHRYTGGTAWTWQKTEAETDRKPATAVSAPGNEKADGGRSRPPQSTPDGGSANDKVE